MDELKTAILNRSKAEYYKQEKSYLREKPKYYFSYPETIQNDLNRNLKNIMTYKKMCDLKDRLGLDMDRDFRMLSDHLDDNGNPLWEWI